MLREGSFAACGPRRSVHARDVALPAALRREPAPVAQRGAQARKERRVIGDPVEGRGGEDRVDGILQLEVEQIAHPHLRPVAEPPARDLRHRL